MPETIVVSPTSNGFRIAGREFAGAALEIEAEGPPAIWVDDHLYRGRVRCVRQGPRKMLVLNVVPLEDYIASVVDGEMPAAFPEAARQAQAIVARTYALFQMQANRASQVFDVYATTRSQNYLGYQYRGRDGRRYAAESPSSRRAADETAGMVCLTEGKLFCTYYTAVCGGRTASGSDVFNDPAAPLESVACEWCHEADLYEWTRSLPGTQAAETVRRYFAAARKAVRRFDVDSSHRPHAQCSRADLRAERRPPPLPPVGRRIPPIVPGIDPQLSIRAHARQRPAGRRWTRPWSRRRPVSVGRSGDGPGRGRTRVDRATLLSRGQRGRRRRMNLAV